MQADQPDFKSMLHPRKNKSLSDVYDTEFLKNPLTEAIKRDLKIGITKDAYLSKEMKSMLERFDRQTRAARNELPMDIHLLKEDEKITLALDQLLMEETPEYPEIILEEESQSATSLNELVSLGLDLKEAADTEVQEATS